MRLHLSRQFLLALGLSLALAFMTGCAFHLRGHSHWPPALRTLYLAMENPYGEFEINLQRSLASAGVQLVSAPCSAPITLKVAKPVVVTRASTIGTSNQTRIYTVTYSVVVTLQNAAGQPLLPPMQLTSIRNLTLSANQMIESNNQLALLEKEMERDIISQLYYRLSSEQVRSIL
ncbi:MAG: LPS assembly lipoprotein LptE [Gammaproteobacteria bacterium]